MIKSFLVIFSTLQTKCMSSSWLKQMQECSIRSCQIPARSKNKTLKLDLQKKKKPHQNWFVKEVGIFECKGIENQVEQERSHRPRGVV